MTWEELTDVVSGCTKCGLCETRRSVVLGDGSRDAHIMFVGEGPGEQEDEQGLPFVGAAGKLFDRILAAIGMERGEVYIANIVKCRPPSNRDPSAEESAACIGYLREQLMLIKPKIIVCLGRIAATSIIDKDYKITRQHGKWIEKKGYHMMATFHPSAVLRDESKKRLVWEDFKSIKTKLLQLEIYERGKIDE